TSGGTTAISSNLISNGSLESLAGWTVGNGSAELKLSGESVDGNHSLLVNQRSKARKQRSGALADVGALDVTGTYQFSAWLRLDDSSVKSRRNGVAFLLVKSKNGKTYRQRLGKLSVVKGQWTNMKNPSFKLKRKIASKGIDSAQLFIYTGGRDDFLLDAVELKVKSAG
ncbi:MAG: carbohydrate binding domain-containing protein, partial [Candidatus Sedimenticola sp. PURPLELP]